MLRKRSWTVRYRGRHAEQANCKKFCVAEDATLSNARTRGSISMYAMFGKTEGAVVDEPVPQLVLGALGASRVDQQRHQATRRDSIGQPSNHTVHRLVPSV